MVPKLTEKERNLQMKKEALISLGLYVAFFLWWYFTGYGLAGDTKGYTYIMGLPLWFFLSCVVGYILFCVAVIVVVKVFFKDFSLDETADEGSGEEERG
ncbi:YhdT family protein [Anaerotignum sp. MB30-C6]|uniref:YhdT family protein n=1 Tax=Anaerotignum sp. MB30-C6 TaxID=3070814 RepID=UPI0027DE3845|nr:YhdT family protein [Anaerotignum sp. MB30-C6]WMI82145.1 YhdT family protein [Anaerotignum sp. MB30-C6]